MSRVSGPGFAVGVVTAALLGLVGSLILRSQWGSASDPYAPPRSADPERVLAGFSGERVDTSGARWSVRLTPLYVDSGRQTFEAETLRRRLFLPAGEPWRVRLSFDASAADSESLALARTSDLTVEDDAGTRILAPIEASVPKGGPADPVRTLFSTSQGISSADGVEWIVWGERPTGAPRAKFGEIEITLEPTSVRSSEVEGPLAQLDRSDLARKKNSSKASDNATPPTSKVR